MNKSESAKCFNEQIHKRWPRWTPSEVETTDWLVWLEKYDYATIAEAARAHLAESRYAKPIPAQLLDHARKNKTNTRPQRRRTDASGIPEAHTFIMCIDKDERGRGCVGRFVDILLWPFHQTWTEADYNRVAAEQARRYGDFYGGDWRVFTHTNQLEMMQCASQLLGTRPLDLSELRKRYKIKPSPECVSG